MYNILYFYYLFYIIFISLYIIPYILFYVTYVRYKYISSNHHIHIGSKYAVEIMNNVPFLNFLLAAFPALFFPHTPPPVHAIQWEVRHIEVSHLEFTKPISHPRKRKKRSKQV